MSIDHAAERKSFEDAVWKSYFQSAIKAGNPCPLDKSTFCTMSNGRYTLPGLEQAWSAWQLRAALDSSIELFGIVEDTLADLSQALSVTASEPLDSDIEIITRRRDMLAALVAGVRTGLPVQVFQPGPSA